MMARPGRKRQRPLGKSPSGGKYLPPDQPLLLTVYLRHRMLARRRPGSGIDLAELKKRLTLAELKTERRKLLQRSVERVQRFAKQQHMMVKVVDYLARTVILKAKVADAERAFSARLMRVDGDGERRHYPRRVPRLPPQLKPIVHAVMGLDTREPGLSRLRSNADAGVGNGLWPSEIARLYGLTTDSRGLAQRVAIIEPAGGYRIGDIKEACAAMRIAVPQITDIAVGKGGNAPGLNARADMEVALDIQVVVGVAPEAHIFVYFTELSEPGLVAGVCRAVHGPERPNVIIITWGEPETIWPEASRLALDAVLQDAVRLGITVLATAGDDLAWERMGGQKAFVNYPASSPYVLGCGGTQISLDAAQAAIADEVVWNDRGQRGTGGGISEFYIVPAFQTGAHLPGSINDGKPGRGVPDVAAAAAAINGYRIVINGTALTASGTSAVAPLWAAFVALLNAERGAALGFVNDQLYQMPALFRVIRSGDNIDSISGLGYSAGPGWSACTGLGSPKGDAIITALTASA
jgi:kumamolisin